MRVMICAVDTAADPFPIERLQSWLRVAQGWRADVLVLPPYLEAVSDMVVLRRLSQRYPDICICTGAHVVPEEDGLYEVSRLVLGGDIVCAQRGLYLSRSQRDRGLRRGREVSVYAGLELPVGISLPTDSWYPEVWRGLALAGARLILCPWAVPEAAGVETNLAFMGTCWQNVHQNTVFAAVSGFSGMAFGGRFRGFAALAGPLWRNGPLDGIYARVEEGCEVVELDGRLLERARMTFDPMRALNPRLLARQSPFPVQGEAALEEA